MIPLRNLKRFFNKTLKQPIYALRVLRKRLGANIYYCFGNGMSGYPESITLFLTHRCNLECKMCGQWGKEGVAKKQSWQYIQEQLPLSQLQSMIDDVSHFKPSITLFGGEPLLYDGSMELINYIKQRDMHCLMITNGFLIDNFAEDIVNYELDELNVSLDGNAGLHDQIRDMPGLFDKIMRGLKQINYFKNIMNKKRPFINLQCTITQYNYRYLEQLIDVAYEACADSLTFHNLIFTDRRLLDDQKRYDNLLGCTSRDWEGFIFDPGIEPHVLYTKMQNILSITHPFSIDFYPNFSCKALMEYYSSPSHPVCSRPCRCLSPWLAAYSFPDGELRPCLNSSYSYGNIKDNRFRQIWNNKQAIDFRRLIKKNRMLPVCLRCTELYRY